MSEWALLDTNILVYAVDRKSTYHEPCKRIRDLAIFGEESCYLCPQVLFEFFSVVTNSKRVTNFITPSAAMGEINRYLIAPGIKIIHPTINVFQIINELFNRHPVESREIFDLHIVATMLANNLRSIHSDINNCA